MAKRRIQIDLILDSEATADLLIAEINSRLATYDVFNIDFLQKSLPLPFDNRWHLIAHIRVNVAANLNDLRDRIKQRWQIGQLANKILAGSRVALHTCTHEEQTPRPCIEDEILVK